MIPLVVPQEDVNSETAMLNRWLVDDGAPVKKDQAVCEVETTKTIFDVAATADGWLVRGAEAQHEVGFNLPIGFIVETQAEIENARAQLRAPVSASAPVNAAAKKITAGARRLMEQHQLVDAQLPDKSIITERDVRLLIDEQADFFSPLDRKARADAPAKAMAQRTLILGAGRGAMQVLDILQHDHRVEVIGYLDDDTKIHGETIYGLPILGSIKLAEEMFRAGRFDAAIISVSTSNALRRRWYEWLKTFGVPFINAIDPTVKINRGARLGEGNVLCAFVHIGVETRIANNNFLSAYNSIDHHNLWGSHITTGPAIATSSRVQVDDDVKMGTGIFIQPGVTIGQGAQIASGAVLTRSVPARHAAKTHINTVVVPLHPKE